MIDPEQRYVRSRASGRGLVWSMKHYILAVSPHNSLPRYLPDPGYTVLCVNGEHSRGVEGDAGMGASSSGHAVRGDARDTCVMER